MQALILMTLVALTASLVLTRIVRVLARRWGFVDCPDGRRKMQKAPVALGGGVAIYLAALATMTLLWSTWNWWSWELWVQTIKLEEFKPHDINKYQMLLIFAAAGLLCAVGLYDDKFQMRGRNKLLLQMLACAIVVYYPGGIIVKELDFFGKTIALGHFGPLLTMSWLLLSINSFNLIDGVDGLAATVGMIFSATFGLMALMMGNVLDGIVAFVLAGSILGFLRFNFNPASIYMGDAGSMVIGLILGALALRSSVKEAALTAFAAPLAVWTIPMLDSGMAILRRKLTGRSIYTTDRGHIHHRLLTRGMSAKQAVALIAGLCAITSVGALAGVYFGSGWLGFSGVVLVMGSLLSTRIFGHTELMLLNSKLIGLGRAFVNFGHEDKSRQSSHQLQGKLQWEEKIWTALVESAERFNLTKLRLNLYLPHLHEDFHATWKRKHAPSGNQAWQLDIPLSAAGMTIGTLNVVGLQDPRAASVQLAQFLDFLEPLESQIHEMLQLSPDAKPLPALLPKLEAVPGFLGNNTSSATGTMDLSGANQA